MPDTITEAMVIELCGNGFDCICKAPNYERTGNYTVMLKRRARQIQRKFLVRGYDCELSYGNAMTIYAKLIS